jgi:hypothetical protein
VPAVVGSGSGAAVLMKAGGTTLSPPRRWSRYRRLWPWPRSERDDRNH